MKGAILTTQVVPNSTRVLVPFYVHTTKRCDNDEMTGDVVDYWHRLPDGSWKQHSQLTESDVAAMDDERARFLDSLQAG